MLDHSSLVGLKKDLEMLHLLLGTGKGASIQRQSRSSNAATCNLTWLAVWKRKIGPVCPSCQIYPNWAFCTNNVYHMFDIANLLVLVSNRCGIRTAKKRIGNIHLEEFGIPVFRTENKNFADCIALKFPKEQVSLSNVWSGMIKMDDLYAAKAKARLFKKWSNNVSERNGNSSSMMSPPVIDKRKIFKRRRSRKIMTIFCMRKKFRNYVKP